MNVQLPYKWGSKPPWGHPLRSIQITIRDLWNARSPWTQRRLEGTWKKQIELYLPPHSLDNFVIRMDVTRHEALLHRNSYAANQVILWIDNYYRRVSISFMDAHGDSLSDYIVFLISLSRRNNRRSCYRLPSERLVGF